MPTIQLLTWNLANREAALDELVTHVSSLQGSFIVAIQECGDDHLTIQKRVHDLGASNIHSMGNGPMSILCSEPLAPMATPRGVGLRLLLTEAVFGGHRLKIVNYHGLARGQSGSPELEERGGAASEARWLIDKHAGIEPVVVLGDFNAGPKSPEVTSVYCLSFAAEPSESSRFSHNRDRADLRVCSPKYPSAVTGTYRFKSHSLGTDWHTLDFIAASRSLDVQTEVLGVMNGLPLTTDPPSDHLPVAGTLELP